MIDFIKFEIEGVNPEEWIKKVDIDFQSKFNHANGDIDNDLLFASFNHITIQIRKNKRVFVFGSLHKYFLGDNSGRFNLLQVRHALEKLTKTLKVELSQCTLRNIEFGVNLNIQESPSRLIRDNVVMYKHITNPTKTNYKNGGSQIEFRSSNYIVKLYDKSAQIHSKDNILRYEVRVKKMVFIKRYGIHTLEDLTNAIRVSRLVERLKSIFKDIFLYNHMNFSKESLREHEILYLKAINPSFWESIKPVSGKYEGGNKNKEYIKVRNNYNMKKKEVMRLFEYYGLFKSKKMIMSILDKEIEIGNKSREQQRERFIPFEETIDLEIKERLMKLDAILKRFKHN